MSPEAVLDMDEILRRERIQGEALESARLADNEGDVEWLGRAALESNWALSPRTLRFLAQLVARLRPAHVLELGSGTSTRVLARALAALPEPGRLSAFDHDPTFAASTRRALAADGTSHVAKVRAVPLVARSCLGTLAPAYNWRSRSLARQAPADLVLIDGPPRALGGRLGTLYQSLCESHPGTLVLLDDAARPDEAEVLRTWQAELGDAIAVRGLEGFDRGLAAVFVRNPAVVARRRSPSDAWYLVRTTDLRRSST